MSLTLAVGIYFVCWWVVLFAILPFGVRTQAEDGEVTPGTVPSAPVAPALLKKFVITTIITTILFAAVYGVIMAGIIPADILPPLATEVRGD